VTSVAAGRTRVADGESEELSVDLEQYIRDIKDFPKEGIVFKDITPLLASPEGFKTAIDTIAEAYADAGVTKVMGAEARGFIFGGALAYRLGAGFVPARKPGKLPWSTTAHTYELEYGTDSLEVHTDALGPDDMVLIVDDVLAPVAQLRPKLHWSIRWAPQWPASRSFWNSTSSRAGRSSGTPKWYRSSTYSDVEPAGLSVRR